MFDPLDWVEAGEDLTDDLDRFYCWRRWVDQRHEYLLDLGVAADDAQFEAASGK